MKTIWKTVIPITDEFEFIWPAGSVPLTVQMQHGELCLWFQCDPDNSVETRTVLVLGTGNPAPNLDDTDHLGSVQDRIFVWHVFLKKNPKMRWFEEAFPE